MRKATFVFMFLLLGLIGCQRYEHPSTWSIIAADPSTGEVGIAAASCVPQSIDALASLVPGQGVAASQAAFVIENRNQVYEMLQNGMPAEAIIENVTASDTGSASRQYAVITLEDGAATLAGFTGSENGDWAGDQQSDELFPVSAQGNILESEAVVADAIAAFNDTGLGDIALSDRLMRALEAGSAAGGDIRCNSVVRQTAAAAFIMVADGDGAPFAVNGFGRAETDDAGTPPLYLSVSGGVGASNPIVELRSQYDHWRETNLEPCESCNLDAIPVPEGGNRLTGVLGTILFIFSPRALAIVGVIIIGIGLLIRRWRQRRKSRSAA